MPTTISGNPASYPTDFTVPSDGDAANASSVNGAFVALANRTANLDQRAVDVQLVLEQTQKFYTWYQYQSAFGAQAITIVTGTPPGVSATGASLVVPAMTIATTVLVDVAFDLEREYVSGISTSVSFNLSSRPSAGGAFTSLGAPSHVKLAQGTAGDITRQRVHLFGITAFAAATAEQEIFLMAGKPNASIASIDNVAMRIVATRAL